MKNKSLPVLHFAHANGFPAETYRKFFCYLQQDFALSYLSMHGHNPQFPVTENWGELVGELIHTIETNYQEPIVGVGHSLGGILTLLAAIERPELFKCFVMLDSPIPSPLRSQLAYLAKWLGFIDKITPAGRSKNRRTHWESVAQAEAYFRTKTLFKHFDPECLSDYVRYGTEPALDGIHLRFDRAVEYQIFRTLPHNLPQYKKRLKVPGGVIYGRDTRIVTTKDLAYMQQHFHVKSAAVAGGHLFPFEYPALAADALKRMVAALLGQ